MDTKKYITEREGGREGEGGRGGGRGGGRERGERGEREGERGEEGGIDKQTREREQLCVRDFSSVC